MGLFDRIARKHEKTLPSPSPPELPQGAPPKSPILTSNGIRNLVTRDDLNPPGLVDLVRSMVGKDLTGPGMVCQTILGRTYLFTDADCTVYEAFNRDGEWTIRLRGQAGPALAEDIGIKTTWSTRTTQDLAAVQRVIGAVIGDRLKHVATDLRFVCEQIEWGCRITRVHFDSELGRIHFHSLHTPDGHEVVVHVETMNVLCRYRRAGESKALEYVDEPTTLPF